jgi:hypothetical protein
LGDGTEGSEALEQTKSDDDHLGVFCYADHENGVKEIFHELSLVRDGEKKKE